MTSDKIKGAVTIDVAHRHTLTAMFLAGEAAHHGCYPASDRAGREVACPVVQVNDALLRIPANADDVGGAIAVHIGYYDIARIIIFGAEAAHQRCLATPDWMGRGVTGREREVACPVVQVDCASLI